MDLAVQRAETRKSPQERERIDDLFRLVPVGGGLALDAGAWDGHLARRLAERYERVVALDLTAPTIDHERVTCVQGDITALNYPDDSFDLVLCTEVLEHVPTERLATACAELARVTRRHLVIGVPFEQDLRLGQTTCRSCGRRNPPWGHVNSFTMDRLRGLFAGLRIEATSLVGQRTGTNALAAKVFDLAGNPWGTYGQEQGCVHCGAKLVAPERGLTTKALMALGSALYFPGVWLRGYQPGWVHLHLVKE
ncbi:class I SAM-dependent methyltransferase [Plantactinospora sp. WMMB782]|uniref:class I SAM-dependent methyltransferase n=1 Tax=Plantactinospora sp. WMMB782 TaxID=3404121 RepID=UPI003B926BBD